MGTFRRLPQASAAASERQFVQARRDAVKVLTSSSSGATRQHVLQKAERGAAVSDGITKEARKLKAKHDERAAVALEDGWILPAEENPAMRSRLQELQQRREARDKAQHQEDKRKKGFVKHRDPVVLRGKRVFVEPDIQSPALIIAITALGMERLNGGDRVLADVYVAQDPANPGQRAWWSAVLSGGRIACPGFMHSKGASGASLVFRAAVASRRSLWLSPAFCAAHDVLTAILVRSMTPSGNKWRRLQSKASFQAASTTATKNNRKYDVLALVTKAEKGMPEFRNMPNVFVGSAFIAFLRRIDGKESTVGACRV